MVFLSGTCRISPQRQVRFKPRLLQALDEEGYVTELSDQSITVRISDISHILTAPTRFCWRQAVFHVDEVQSLLLYRFKFRWAYLVAGYALLEIISITQIQQLSFGRLLTNGVLMGLAALLGFFVMGSQSKSRVMRTVKKVCKGER